MPENARSVKHRWKRRLRYLKTIANPNPIQAQDILDLESRLAKIEVILRNQVGYGIMVNALDIEP